MSLEQRIEALERANRRLRAAVIGLALAAVAGIGLGAAQEATQPGQDATQDLLRARTLEIVGPDGTATLVLQSAATGSGEILLRNGKGGVAATLSADPTGAGRFGINGRNGQPIVLMAPSQFGGTINTYTDESKPLARIAGNGLGQGALSLYSAHSAAPNLTLAGEENGDGAIGTYNAQGRRLVQIGATSGGVGKIVTYNGVGKTRVELGSTDTGGFVGAFGDGESPIVAMSSTVKGDGLLRTYTADGVPLCGFEVDANGMPRFTIYGPDGAIAKVMP